ncbi:hypothetical protein TanjilG_13880 [Lupinus angustifolius]|uniref:Uncharacterized protein n=1 Tax=Lupinus angustifolius TaxID=3871 RepID=A0A1J7HDI0_LUPAN|nr:hypothetical protein TanjilG_13880 [Lupinus angustifolius]
MEFSITATFQISFVSFLVLLSVATSQLNPCNFPAIFNFGASNSDTGGFSAALSALKPPFGETFFHRPAGRISDGRIILDFIGGIFATLIPKQEYFSKALYTFDIGQNDLTALIFGNMTKEQVKASVSDIVKTFSENVKNIYNLGARSFWIHNTGPLGCLSLFLTKFPSAEKDEYGCAKANNEVAQYFNQQLKEALAQLRKEFPDAAITYVDIYSAKLSLFQDPKKYGFELPHVACCGYGGEYNFDSGEYCGGTINVNGTNILVGSCKNPSARILWDGIHYTEAANKVVFDKISTGAFSDPPVPLNMTSIFNFGASNSDTGGYSVSMKALKSPYGETYFHRPAGRYSDGRIILDFIAQNFGLPYLSPYLDSLGSNFSTGANFGTAGSTIQPQSNYSIVGYVFSPFSLDVQYNQFINFIPRTKFFREKGGIFATLMPKEEHFSKALYTYDIGQNDLTASFASFRPIKQIIDSIPDIVKKFTENVKVVKYPSTGFEDPQVACCGYGGKYNCNLMVGCGNTIKVNGTEISAGSCGKASVRVMWDGTHYTEAANKVVFDKISSGAFTDPPIPLNMACLRSIDTKF